ncbi:MAG: DNA repair exonuclease [Candidatus Sericytochromatia bacterium]|nr:DNA repair exonuclease [Candidatus Sericytochromatia bacterium]
MSSFTFVHAADLHLDAPFKGVSRVDPDVAVALRDASLEAWDALVALCLREQAAFLLLAGDLHDGEMRGLRAGARLQDGLKRLADAGCRTFIVRGNHDAVDAVSDRMPMPEGVHVFPAGMPTSVPVRLGDRHLATIHGVSHAGPAERENLARRFPVPVGPGPHIALLHAHVGGDADHAPYAPCTVSDLAASGHDYWALGHIHRRTVRKAGRAWVVYPGNLQGRSPKPSECGPKGAMVCRVRDGLMAEPEFVPLDRWRFASERLLVPPAADLVVVRNLLRDAAEKALAEAEGRGVLLRLVLFGTCGLAHELLRPGVGESLRQILDDRTPERLLVLPLVLEVRGEQGRGGDATGGPANALRGWSRDMPQVERRAWMLALLDDLRDPDGRGGLTETLSDSLWEEAEALALAMLAGERGP